MESRGVARGRGQGLQVGGDAPGAGGGRRRSTTPRRPTRRAKPRPRCRRSPALTALPLRRRRRRRPRSSPRTRRACRWEATPFPRASQWRLSRPKRRLWAAASASALPAAAPQATPPAEPAAAPAATPVVAAGSSTGRRHRRAMPVAAGARIASIASIASSASRTRSGGWHQQHPQHEQHRQHQQHRQHRHHWQHHWHQRAPPATSLATAPPASAPADAAQELEKVENELHGVAAQITELEQVPRPFCEPAAHLALVSQPPGHTRMMLKLCVFSRCRKRKTSKRKGENSKQRRSAFVSSKAAFREHRQRCRR